MTLKMSLTLCPLFSTNPPRSQRSVKGNAIGELSRYKRPKVSKSETKNSSGGVTKEK